MAGIDKTYVNTWNDYKAIRDWAQSVGTVTDDYGNKLTPFNWLYHPDLTEKEFYENQKRCWEEAKERYAKYQQSDDKYDQESYNWMIENYGEDFLDHPELFYEVVIWNTDHVEDIYLIRYCPLEVIQNRLKQQYGGGWSKQVFTDHNDSSMYEQIKNRISVYDTYVRPNNTHPKFIIKPGPSKCKNDSFKDDDINWWIDITLSNNRFWSYYEVEDEWHNDLECYVGRSNWISSCCDKLWGNMTPRRIYRLLRKWNLPSGTTLRFVGDYHRRTVKDFLVTVK